MREPPGAGEPEGRKIPRSKGLLLRLVARSIQSRQMGREDQCRQSVPIFLVNRRKQRPL